jgi:hypothetical protein
MAGSKSHIFSHIISGKLNSLTDVNAGSPSDGQSLKWDNATSKWIAGAGTSYPTAANYSALPAAADHSGEIYICLAGEGVWLLARKKAGMWRSDGASWTRLGNFPDAFNTTNFFLHDNADNTKLVNWDITAITTGNTRTITMPDANVDLSTAGDEKVKIDAAAAAGYLGAASNDGVLRTGAPLTYTDGGDFITLDVTTGIADNNVVEIDDADAADNDYAKFTANGLEGRSYAEVKTDLSLSNVEDTAVSTWVGSANITTLGTIGTGTWGATDIAVIHGGTGTSTGEITLVQGAARTIQIAEHATTVGDQLTIAAGRAKAGETDKTGGVLVLASGVGTGAGGSYISFQASKAAASGSGDNAVVQVVAIDGTSLTLSPHGTAAGETSEIRFLELAANGTNYVALKAPDALAASYTLTLPTTDGGVKEMLQTDGSGVLSWVTIGIADDNLVEIDGADIADDEYARFTANGLESRTAAEVTADLSAATTTAQGASELATTAEVNTGTDTGRTICPDALAGSYAGTKTVILKVVADDTAPTAGDGKMHFTVPAELNGMNLVTVGAHVYTASGASGPVTVMIHNLTDTTDMLSTAITIDDTEIDSATAGTAAVINGAADDVVTADIIRIDVDDIGDSATRGLEVRMGFRLP